MCLFNKVNVLLIFFMLCWICQARVHHHRHHQRYDYKHNDDIEPVAAARRRHMTLGLVGRHSHRHRHKNAVGGSDIASQHDERRIAKISMSNSAAVNSGAKGASATESATIKPISGTVPSDAFRIKTTKYGAVGSINKSAVTKPTVSSKIATDKIPTIGKNGIPDNKLNSYSITHAGKVTASTDLKKALVKDNVDHLVAQLMNLMNSWTDMPKQAITMSTAVTTQTKTTKPTVASKKPTVVTTKPTTTTTKPTVVTKKPTVVPTKPTPRKGVAKVIKARKKQARKKNRWKHRHRHRYRHRYRPKPKKLKANLGKKKGNKAAVLSTDASTANPQTSAKKAITSMKKQPGKNVPTKQSTGKAAKKSKFTINPATVSEVQRPSFVKDNAVWMGFGVGLLMSMVLFIMGCCVYQTVMDHLRKKGIKLFGVDGLNEGEPLRLSLSKTSGHSSNNSQYMVSISKSKINEELSSEEEVFNVSKDRPPMSPIPNRTSTPMSTPIKQKWKTP